MTHDPFLLVRAASIYLAVVATAAVWKWRRPQGRALVGALLAFIWNVPVILALHLLATWAGWWSIEARGGLILGMPVELMLVWALMWGSLPALAFPRLSIVVLMAMALGVDLVAMPFAEPVVRLGPLWLIGEAIGLLAGLVPGQLIARWTSRDERLAARAVLQMVMFAGLVLFLLPVVIIETAGGTWVNPLDRAAWQLSLCVQLLAAPAVLGLTAVQEFVERGHGTPVPFDPPRRLVTTGVYAYVRNPMQVSAIVILFLLGIILEHVWIAAAGVMAHIYSLGLAGSDEDEDLRARFGDRWMAYKHGVRRWCPRWRPWYPPDSANARLYVSESCDMCRQVGRWFDRHGARGLSIVPAESHPSGALTRMTYEPADGTGSGARAGEAVNPRASGVEAFDPPASGVEAFNPRASGVEAFNPRASGVEAFARAIEHIHFGWALLAFVVRLPLVRSLVQLLADASGAEPRTIARVDLASPGSTCQ
jgi:protein-S-isoprenylcysteine O-methyltransferase Ste14